MLPTDRAALSDQDGAFTIFGVEPGLYALAAEGAHVRGLSELAFEVELASHVEGALVRVERAASVRGRVQIEQGEGCSQGRLLLTNGPDPTIAPIPGTPPEALARTEVQTQMAALHSDGSVNFQAVPHGRYHAVLQCLDHVLASGPRIVEVGNQDIDGLSWRADKATTLVVHVEDEARMPVPGVTLQVHLPAKGPGLPAGRMAVATDAAGVAFVHNLAPGHFEVHVPSERSVAPSEVDVRPGDYDVPVRVTLPGSGRILAQVVDGNGRGVDGLRVLVEPVPKPSPLAKAPDGVQQMRALAEGDGRYRAGPLREGRYRVEVGDRVNAPVFAESVTVRGQATSTVRIQGDRIKICIKSIT